MFEAVNENWPNRHLLITQRLRQRRLQLGLTQKQVVTRLAHAGVRTTNRALSSLEHGAGIDVARVPELARALDCTITYLVGLTGDPHRWEPDTAQSASAPPPSPPASRLATLPPATSLILADGVPQRDLGL